MGEVVPFPRSKQAQGEQEQGESQQPEQQTAREPLWREVVGHELRDERQRIGRTLTDVADGAAVSPQYLSEIERGLKEPSSEVLGAVAGALGLRLADLTTRATRRLTRSSEPFVLAA